VSNCLVPSNCVNLSYSGLPTACSAILPTYLPLVGLSLTVNLSNLNRRYLDRRNARPLTVLFWQERDSKQARGLGRVISHILNHGFDITHHGILH
jgi:hypothetical protein